ncbi:uncharacterized protein LOC144227981 isoform X3 [Crocuta crocuta]
MAAILKQNLEALLVNVPPLPRTRICTSDDPRSGAGPAVAHGLSPTCQRACRPGGELPGSASWNLRKPCPLLQATERLLSPSRLLISTAVCHTRALPLSPPPGISRQRPRPGSHLLRVHLAGTGWKNTELGLRDQGPQSDQVSARDAGIQQPPD